MHERHIHLFKFSFLNLKNNEHKAKKKKANTEHKYSNKKLGGRRFFVGIYFLAYKQPPPCLFTWVLFFFLFFPPYFLFSRAESVMNLFSLILKKQNNSLVMVSFRGCGQPTGGPRRTVSGYIKICGAPSGEPRSIRLVITPCQPFFFFALNNPKSAHPLE